MLNNLKGMLKDSDGKVSTTRLVVFIIILSVLTMYGYSVGLGKDIPLRVASGLELLVISAMSLMGVNTVGNRFVVGQNSKKKEIE